MYTRATASRHLSPKALWASILVALAVVATALPAAAQTTEVLVPGDSPLTQQMVDTVISYYEWELDGHFTPDQRVQLQELLVQAWTDGDQDVIDSAQEAIGSTDLFAKYDDRDSLKSDLQNVELMLHSEHPDAPLNRLLFDVYTASHVALAPGNPPLTREMSDAFIDFYVFAANQVWGTNIQTTPQLKDRFAKAMAAAYPGYSPNEQRSISLMPGHWTYVQVHWQTGSDAERDAFRQQWAALVGSPPVGTPSADSSAERNPPDDRPATASATTSNPVDSGAWSSRWVEHVQVQSFINSYAPIVHVITH